MAQRIHDPPGKINSPRHRHALFLKDLLDGTIDAESMRVLPNGKIKYKTKGSKGGPPDP